MLTPKRPSLKKRNRINHMFRLDITQNLLDMRTVISDNPNPYSPFDAFDPINLRRVVQCQTFTHFNLFPLILFNQG